MPYNDHSATFPPDNSQTIWKFMDIAKFLSLVVNNELFFARLTSLPDPWEGCLPAKYYNLTEDEIKKLVRPLDGMVRPLDGIHKETEPQALKSLFTLLHSLRGKISVCCFHAGENDSEAFWKLYSDIAYGIAIKTTVEKLKLSLEKEESREIYISNVKYIDYESEQIPFNNLMYPAIHKRGIFSYENEVRAINMDLKSTEDGEIINKDKSSLGFPVKVDTSVLIQEILISPLCPDWFYDTCCELFSKLGFKFKIRRSSLYKGPGGV